MSIDNNIQNNTVKVGLKQATSASLYKKPNQLESATISEANTAKYTIVTVNKDENDYQMGNKGKIYNIIVPMGGHYSARGKL